jgi:hypothetical protein
MLAQISEVAATGTRAPWKPDEFERRGAISKRGVGRAARMQTVGKRERNRVALTAAVGVCAPAF